MIKAKKSFFEKEQGLLEMISDARRKLTKLQEKQKIEIGNLAYKHGLHKLDIEKLDLAFSKISKELVLEG